MMSFGAAENMKRYNQVPNIGLVVVFLCPHWMGCWRILFAVDLDDCVIPLERYGKFKPHLTKYSDGT